MTTKTALRKRISHLLSETEYHPATNKTIYPHAWVLGADVDDAAYSTMTGTYYDRRHALVAERLRDELAAELNLRSLPLPSAGTDDRAPHTVADVVYLIRLWLEQSTTETL